MVLGIIGLIADMTIPTLHQKIDEKVTVTRLKKAYSTLQSAFTMAVSQNGSPLDWDLAANKSPEGAQRLAEKFIPYLNIIKNCGLDVDCLPDLHYTYLNGVFDASYNFANSTFLMKLLIADGTIYYIYVLSPDCSYESHTDKLCGSVYVDVNGVKKPNVRGKDVFEFWIAKDKIIPTGGPNDKSFMSFENTCKPSSSGIGCTSWVIYKGNLDYLRKNDLKWD